MMYNPKRIELKKHIKDKLKPKLMNAITKNDKDLQYL